MAANWPTHRVRQAERNRRKHAAKRRAKRVRRLTSTGKRGEV